MELPAYFEALMNRAPIAPAEIATYLREMRQTPSGPLITSKLLAGKIQSSSEAQALHAFEFLEAALESESEGSIEFRTEIGRYRFLNEIIRILSPKYLGDQTCSAVKERAIRFLADAAGTKKQRWFPSEHSKIIMVYQSLVDSGIIKPADDALGNCEDAAEAELQKSIFDRQENAAALKKLLASKDPADLQAANRLIKNLVDEEAKRSERRAELHSLIDRIDTTTSLLTEMLNQTHGQRQSQGQGDGDFDLELDLEGDDLPSMDKELVDDLADTCRTLRLKLGAVATETGDEATSLLQASQNIETALQLYEDGKQLKPRMHPSKSKSNSNNSNRSKNKSKNNVDLLGDSNSVEATSLGSLTLADELLMGISQEFATVTSGGGGAANSNTNPGRVVKEKEKENLLLNFDVEIKGQSQTKSQGQGQGHSQSEQGQGDADKSEVEDKRVTSFSEIERMSRQLLEEGLRNSKSTLLPLLPQQPPQKTKTLSELQSHSLNIANTNASVNNSSTPMTMVPEVNVNANNGQGQGTDIALLDLDFLDKSKSNSKSGGNSLGNQEGKCESENVNVGEKNSVNVSVSSAWNGSGKSWNEDDTLLLPLEDEKEKINASASVSASAGTSVNASSGTGTSFSLNSVKELDLEEIEFVEEVEPIDLNLTVETDDGVVKCKHVGLTLTFGILPHFPRNVHVLVITLTNRSSSSVLLNYVFQLLPPKGMQVKLLAPSCMDLPPWKKCFLPPPLLTQVAVLLVAPPTQSPLPTAAPLPPGKNMKMRFILSYCLGEDTTLHNGHFDLPPHLFDLHQSRS